jgi:hypothetical protein
MGVVYVVMAVVTFFWSLYLYTSLETAVKEGVSLYNDSQLEATAAFGKLKSFFKLWGMSQPLLCWYPYTLYNVRYWLLFGGLGAWHR